MNRWIVLCALLIGYLLITAGLTWLLGPWALIGCGAVLLVAALFVDVKE